MLLDVHTKRSKEFPGEYSQTTDDFRGVEWMPDSAGLMIQSRDGFRIVGLDGKVKKHWKRVAKAADHPEKVLEALRAG